MSLIKSPALFVAETEVAKTCKNEGVAVDMVREILENLNAEQITKVVGNLSNDELIIIPKSRSQ